MLSNSIKNVLGFLMVAFLISACSTPEVLEPIIEVREIPIERPAPIVPEVDQLNLAKVSWVVVTPSNVDVVFADLKRLGTAPVLFALTDKGYENVSLNLNDLRSMIEQQRAIIGLYENSYDRLQPN